MYLVNLCYVEYKDIKLIQGVWGGMCDTSGRYDIGDSFKHYLSYLHGGASPYLLSYGNANILFDAHCGYRENHELRNVK